MVCAVILAAALVASADCGWRYDAAAGRLEQALDAAAVARGDKPWSFALKADGVLGLNARGAGAVLDLRRRTMPADAPEIRAIASIYRVGFQEEATCRELHLPETVTNIADQCFHKWKALRDVDIPATGPLVIGNQAFTECPALTNVTIASAKRLGEQVFYFDAALEGVRLPENLEEIGKSCFWGCKALKTVTPFLPKTIRRIGRDAFRSCPSIESPLEIGFGRDAAGNPIRVEKLPEWACYECRKIPSVKYGPGVVDIGAFLAASCDGLGSIEFGEAVTNLTDSLGILPLTNIVFRGSGRFALAPTSTVFRFATDLKFRFVVPGDNVDWARFMSDVSRVKPWEACAEADREAYFKRYGAQAKTPAGITVAVPNGLPRTYLVRDGAVLRRFPLNIPDAPDGAATVKFDPKPDADGAYAPGTEVRVTVVPADGYDFVSWQGDCPDKGVRSRTVTVRMDRARYMSPLLSRSWYVAPNGDDANDGSPARRVRTLERALELARTRTGIRRRIVLGDGFYAFDRCVTLTAKDSGTELAAEHAGKAVISGALPLSGWKRDPSDARFLTAPLPFEQPEGATCVLTVNGKMRKLACYPEEGKGRLGYRSTGGNTRLYYQTNGLPQGVSFSDIDIRSAWLVIPQEWATTVTRIAEHDAKDGCFVLKEKTGMTIGQFNQGYQIMNVRMGITRPGMWMFDVARKEIVYWPEEGERPDSMVSSVSRAHALLRAEQTQDVTVDGIVFEGCLALAGAYEPYGSLPINAAVAFINPVRATVRNCEVRDCAGIGIHLLKSRDSRVENVRVHDVGGMCVDFRDGDSGAVVTGCELYEGGAFNSADPLLHLQLQKFVCTGNVLHDGPGCGATVWTSGSDFASNEIYRVMKTQRDGGGLYGASFESVFHDNYVHDITGWPGLYQDEGAMHISLYGNRVENCPWPIHFHSTQFVTVTNNVMKCDKPMFYSFQGSGHGIFSDNRLYVPEAIKTAPHLESLDFWGRNEVFVRQADGTYASQGPVTLPRPKSLPRGLFGVASLKGVKGAMGCPFRPDGGIEYNAFYNVKGKNYGYGLVVGEDGHFLYGVPFSSIRFAYDETWFYVGWRRFYNAFCPYPGVCNLMGRGWKACDAYRLDFEGGRTIILSPDGTVETSGGINVKNEDFRQSENKMFAVLRIPLSELKAKGGVIGMNAACWIHDPNFKEAKFLCAPRGGNYVTGTLVFTDENETRDPEEFYETDTPAHIIFVAPDGTGGGTSWADAASLESALEKASRYTGEVWLKEGTYVKTADSPNYAFWNQTTFRGGFRGTESSLAERPAGTVSTIDGCGKFQTLCIWNYLKTVKFERLHFRRSSRTGFARLPSTGDLVFDTCAFVANGKDYGSNLNGRGACFEGAQGVGTVTMTNCVFADNTADPRRNIDIATGYGAFFRGLKEVVLAGCLFVSNGCDRAVSERPSVRTTQGAAFYAQDVPVKVRNCRFVGNSSFYGASAGIVELNGKCGGSVFERCLWRGNRLVRGISYDEDGGLGALVLNLSATDQRVEVRDCGFVSNEVETVKGAAGVSVRAGTVDIRHSAFRGNIVPDANTGDRDARAISPAGKVNK